MAKNEFSYKEAIEEIENIMYKLENEEIDLDELSKNVKRASELIANCKGKLRSTESEIEKIIEKISPQE
jgi:exodeoxyribonuclease VII small subunit